MRPSRGAVFMEIAYAFSQRSTCPRAQVGAVVVVGSRIVSHGYNGAAPGASHCTDLGCTLGPASEGPHKAPRGCQRAIHAEANAVAYAARVGVSCAEGVMYSTHEPCRKCAELILVAGIQEVWWDTPYRDGASFFLRGAGIQAGHQGPPPTARLTQ